MSCQVKVKQDLEIIIPEELFLVKEYRARVADISDLTPEIKGLCLDILTPGEGIAFRPGQYVQLEVPKYRMTNGPEFRAYSISSDSLRNDRIDLVITRVPRGAVSTYVHDHLKKGQELLLNGPYGDFFLRESERGILLVSTGSGLAPVMSILRQIEAEEIQRETRLFFGARTRKDLYYLDELSDLESKITNFTFTATLSRPEEGDKWEGERGRVTDLIEKYTPERASIDAYLCGSPAMVESCMDLLLKKGIPRDRIFFDKFE